MPTRVPFGGFLLAQQMIFWAISKESWLFSCQPLEVSSQWITRVGTPLFSKPGPELTFPCHHLLPQNQD